MTKSYLYLLHLEAGLPFSSQPLKILERNACVFCPPLVRDDYWEGEVLREESKNQWEMERPNILENGDTKSVPLWQGQIMCFWEEKFLSLEQKQNEPGRLQLWICLQVGRRASQAVLVVKNPPANAGDISEDGVRSLGGEDPLEEGRTTHSSNLAWRIPWTEEPGRLWSKVSKRIRHDWNDLAHTQVGKRNKS